MEPDYACSSVRVLTRGPIARERYGYRRVPVLGYVEQMVIGCGADVVVRHRRSYEGEDTVFNPLHYLPLIETKLGALDQAAQLERCELLGAFATLRTLI